MDTRNKILSWAEAKERLAAYQQEGIKVLLVTGYFDPLLAPHARDLADLARDARLIVLVLDPPEPILPNRARAELVAALRSVSYVVPFEGEQALPLNEALRVAECVRLEEQHLDYRRQFVDHVLRRHDLAAATSLNPTTL